MNVVDQGQELGLVFLDEQPSVVEVYFQRVAYDGQLLGSTLKISDQGTTPNAIEPQLRWLGNGYLAAWRGGDARMRSVCP